MASPNSIIDEPCIYEYYDADNANIGLPYTFERQLRTCAPAIKTHKELGLYRIYDKNRHE